MDETTKKIASLCREIQKIWDREDMLSISIDHNYISFFALEHIKGEDETNNYIIRYTEFKEVKNGDSNN